MNTRKSDARKDIWAAMDGARVEDFEPEAFVQAGIRAGLEILAVIGNELAAIAGAAEYLAEKMGQEDTE